MTISGFLSAFFSDDNEPLHLRAFKPKGEPGTPHNCPLKFVTSRAELAGDRKLQGSLQGVNKTRGVYFVVNSGGDCDDDITRFNGWFAEDDTRSIAEQHARLDSAPIQPAIRVETRKSVHAYWPIGGPCSKVEWRDIQARLIGYFGGDPQIKNPSRVMRLPGFDHLHLNGNGVERKKVTVHTFEPERRYTVVQMREAFPSLVTENTSDRYTCFSTGPFHYHEDRHEELSQRIMSRGRRNSRGNWEAPCFAHNGKGKTGLVYFPGGAVTCNSNPKCDYFAILRAEGLPDGHLPPRDAEEGSKDRSPKSEVWEIPTPFHESDLPEFPSDALPSWLSKYIEGLALETQTPVDLAAMQTIAVCAGAVAGRVRIQARPGWVEPLNIYVISVLPPGERKSAVSARIRKPLEELEAELLVEMRDTVVGAASERRILDERRARLEKEAARIDDATERKSKQNEALNVAHELALATLNGPVLPRLICDDITPESLASLLVDQNGRLCLFSPEGDLFEMIAGRYTNGAPNIDVILKAHCGDTLRVDRRGRSEHVPHPALTIGLCVQPEVIRGLADKPGFRGRGLVGRFLFSMPKSMLGRRKVGSAALPLTVSTEYLNNVKALGKLESAQNAEGEHVPRLLYLTVEADALLRVFEMELEPQLGEDGAMETMNDWAGKLSGAILRIAGILSLTEQVEALAPFPEHVSAQTVQRAISIGRYLIPHAKAAYAEMGADPQIENAKRLLRSIEKNGQSDFTKRDIHQRNKGYFKKVTEIESALDLLEAHGYIRARVDTSERRVGRKASPIYDVNPILFSTSHNSQKSHNSTSMHTSCDSEHSGADGSGHSSCDSDEDVIVTERLAIES